MANTGLHEGQLANISPQGGVDIRQLFIILLRQRFLILSISGIVLVIASLLASQAKPTYQSSMQILVSSNLYEAIRSNNNQAMTDNEFTDPNVQVVDYTAQLRLMLSYNLIQKAVLLLRPQYPNIIVEDLRGKRGKQAPLVIFQLEGGAGMNKVLSPVFEVSFKNSDPVKTQRVLQALQTVYQEYNIDQQKKRVSKGLSFVSEQLPKVKEQMIRAQRNLQLFRSKNNLLDPEVQSKILLQYLADIQKQLQITRAQLQEVEARYRNIQQKVAASPENALISSRLSQSTHYQTLLNEIQKTELTLAQQRQRYTDNSPIIEDLMQQRQRQLVLLQEEVGRSLGKQSTQVSPITGKPLLTQGQLGGVDLKLVEGLIEVQTTALGLRANEKSLAESEKHIRSELSRYPSLIADYNRLLPEAETNRKTFEQLMTAQQSLAIKIAQAGFDWQVLEGPRRGTYLGSGRLIPLLGGVVIGPILGIATALLWEISRDAIYSAKDVQQLTNLRLLGKVPKLPPVCLQKRLLTLPCSELQNLQPSFSKDTISIFSKSVEVCAALPTHESLDISYQNIQTSSPLPYKSLMLTSALSGEGKSTIALGLAVSAARVHQRVLVVDANLRSPSLHKILDLSNNKGFSTLLIDDRSTPVEKFIQPIHPSIDILTAGPTPNDTIQLLSSGRMKKLIESFEKYYDLVLIDAPEMLSTVDSRIIASACKAILIVAGIGKVTRTELVQTTEILNKLNVIGILANQDSNSIKKYKVST